MHCIPKLLEDVHQELSQNQGGKEKEGRKERGREGKGSRCQYLQWNLSNTDTLKTTSEVSLLQRENKLGKCCLTRCPHFRGVL